MKRTAVHILFVTTLLVSGVTDPAQAGNGATIEEIQKAAQANARSARHWDQLGLALSHQRRFAEAMQAFDRALEIEPGSTQVRHHLALAYAWDGKYDEAARVYEALLEQNPDAADIRVDYGQVLAWDKRFDDARSQYELVLAGNPDHIEAMRHMGVLSGWMGDYDEALEWLAKCLALEPESFQILLNQAEVLVWKGDLRKASVAYEQAHALRPRDHIVLRELGQVHFWLGDVRKAVREYRQAIEVEPQDVRSYLGLSEAYVKTKQFDEARQVLRDAAKLFPADQRIGDARASLAAMQSWDTSDYVNAAEPILYIVVLMVIYRHTRRFRRVMRQQHALASVLFSFIPLLALALAGAYVFSLLGTAYYGEVEHASQWLEILALFTLATVFFSLVWLLRFERPVRSETILAIGAHPDDIEFGCGATIMRSREEGCSIFGLVLTGGGKGFEQDQDPSRRMDEARASAQRLAMTDVRIMDFPDTRLASFKDDIMQAIENMIKEVRPDIVFTHTPHDVHKDHKAVFEATREAARGACTVLSYENPNTPPSFQPDYFVDITDYIDDKIAALAKHKTQAGKAYATPDVVRNSAGFRGAQAKVKYAEAFKTLRVLHKASS